MNIPAIKTLVQKYSIQQLSKAEEEITEGKPPSIEVEGEDDGEQLTHVIAAVWILKHMDERKTDFKTALRDYTRIVRSSIN